MWLHVQFYGFPDEAVHVTRFGGEEFGILKFDYVVWNDAMFCYC
jgi:hypothetical protein